MSSEINQPNLGNENQSIGQVYGGLVVYVSGGEVNINPPNLADIAEPQSTVSSQSTHELGPNPYQGLLAFSEADGDRFFGREQQIQELWNRFQALHDDVSAVRFLPIYGPSGSGKSSLARAGLLPELGRRPLPGRGRARVAVLVPGDEPLYSLAMVLAKIATEDQNPVEKAEEFKRVLSQPDDGKYRGLKHIAYGFQDISAFPLIVVVDQFEELYSYEPKGISQEEENSQDKFVAEREAFIGNLLHAVSDETQYVSAIVTFRSDFLGETQLHPSLNSLFSKQGYLVPIIQPEELEIAIAEPAKRAGYKFHPSTIQLLVEQMENQSGALPLLQVALKQIWEGLEQGYKPPTTLKQLGGVGGALANEAQRLYDSLNENSKKVAPRIFLALVRLDDGSKIVTRRRARKSEISTGGGEQQSIESIIQQFSAPRVRYLVTSYDPKYGEIIEVAHESLIHNWPLLKLWTTECRESLLRKQKIEQDAEIWRVKEKDEIFLLEGRALRNAQEFRKEQNKNSRIQLSTSATEFIQKSSRKSRRALVKLCLLFTIFPVFGTLLFTHFSLLRLANSALYRDDCNPNFEARLLLQYAMKVGNKRNLEQIRLCGEKLIGLDITDTNLWGAEFKNAILVDTSFQDSNLADVSFERAILHRSNFKNARLENTNFHGSDLSEADFGSAIDLTEDQIEKARLCKTILPESFRIDADRDCEN